MKDIIEQWVEYTSSYLAELGSLVSGPKRFIEQKNVGPDSTLDEPLRFLAISIAIAVIIGTGTELGRQGIWEAAVANSVVALLSLTLMAAAARTSWWIVRGKAPMRSFFCIYAYYYSVGCVFAALVNLFAIGIVRLFDPDLHQSLLSTRRGLAPPPDLSSSSAGLAVVLMYGFASMLAGIWGFFAWGAFRRINGVGRWRSAVALVLVGLFSLPVMAGVFFVAYALH